MKTYIFIQVEVSKYEYKKYSKQYAGIRGIISGQHIVTVFVST